MLIFKTAYSSYSCFGACLFSKHTYYRAITAFITNFRQLETEIIDLSNNSTNCTDLEIYQEDVFGTVGQLINDQFPLVCGGAWPYVDSCYAMGTQNSKVTKLNQKIAFGASVKISDRYRLCKKGSLSILEH